MTSIWVIKGSLGRRSWYIMIYFGPSIEEAERLKDIPPTFMRPRWEKAPRISHDGQIILSGDRKSPKDRVVGPLLNGQTSWLINGGDPTYESWDDPPSGPGELPSPHYYNGNPSKLP